MTAPLLSQRAPCAPCENGARLALAATAALGGGTIEGDSQCISLTEVEELVYDDLV